MIKKIYFIIKAIVLVIVGYLVVFNLIWPDQDVSGPPSYPSGLGRFNVVKSATINPSTLLEEIRSEKQFIHQIYTDIPNTPSSEIPVEWSQSEYLEVARAFQKAIWQDDPNMWHLFNVSFQTHCETLSDKFAAAEFVYYQEVRRNGEIMYSVRDINVAAEYGYVAWGEDTYYEVPFFDKWTEINQESMASTPAEKALKLADQGKGREFRNSEESCHIDVTMWPWIGNDGWKVLYSGITSMEIWIP